jgi:WD40 repeat protein
VRAVAPDGSWVVTGAAGRLRVWDVREGRPCGVLRAGVEPVTGAVLSHFGADITACVIAPDGRWLVSVAGDSCQFWDMTAGGRPFTLPGAVGGAVLAVSPDGRWIVAGRRDGGLVVTELVADDHEAPVRPKATRQLSGHRDAVTGAAVTPDARSIVSVGADRAVRVWDVEAGREVAALFLPTRIDAVVLHPWRPWIACRTTDGDTPVEIAGMEYGPIVVTARGPDSTVVCPACATEQTVGASGLGRPLRCRGLGCSLTLAVNPFVVRGGPPSGLYDDADEQVRREWYDTP